MIVHSEVFERFTQGDTIPVMAQAAMENALSPRMIDGLFENVAERQYTRDLLFSSIVELMSLVVCGIQPSINAAYRRRPCPSMSRSRPSTARSTRIETPIGSALVGLSAERLAPVITAMGGGLTPFLPGYRTQDPRRQSPARNRAPHQGVADDPGRGLARPFLGRASTPN